MKIVERPCGITGDCQVCGAESSANCRRMPVEINHQWDAAKGACACGWKPAHPSHGMSHLHIEEPLFAGKPSLWIQWKGTNVCCDIYCACGTSMHYDGDFLYFFRCASCGQVWETGTSVHLYKVNDNRADGAIIQEIEDNV